MRHLRLATRFLLPGALGVLLAACGSLSSEGPVRIRVTNATAYELREVVVGFPDGEEAYGDLAAGASSGYRTVPRAYRYAYVEAVVQGETYVQQPIDYVGEELLEEGSYSYVLTLEAPGDRFGLRTTLRRDDP